MIFTMDFAVNMFYNTTGRFDWLFNPDLDDVYVGF